MQVVLVFLSEVDGYVVVWMMTVARVFRGSGVDIVQ